MFRGKKYKDSAKQIDRGTLYDPKEGLELVCKTASAKFDETVELHVKLGVDSRHADQQVRGAIVLPHGTGKTVRVLVFTKGDKADAAREAGADYVGDMDMVEKIQKENWFDFDVVIASPDMMGVVGRLGKILGPKGLMPNPKAGTVSMDVAKAVGVVAKFGGTIGDYEGVGKVPGPIDTLIAVPTTAGTGSEVTVAAVITDEARNYKLSVLGPEISPTYAVLDPELIMTAPASVAAACGVDALIHAMESYINTDANPFAMAMGEKAMELIGGNIRKFVARRNDPDAACAMMLGSTFAGIAFANNRLGDIHAMSHPVSAFFHVAHGVANAVLMPTIFEFNALAADERYANIYQYITGKEAGPDFVPQMLCDALRQLNNDLGIPACLADVGVTEDKIPQMAVDAMKSGNVMVNPRITTVKDVEALYHKAMYK